MEFFNTLLIACIPAIITGVVSFILAKAQAKNSIKQMDLANKQDLEKLIEQHKVDIDSIQEKHRLEMEAKDKDHKLKLEVIQLEHENELIRKTQELENTAKFNAIGSITTGLFKGIFDKAIATPEAAKLIGMSFTDAMKKDKDADNTENIEK